MEKSQRFKVKIKPDVDVVAKRDALVRKVCERKGEGWDFVGVEGEGESRYAVFERVVSVSEVTQSETKIWIKLNASESKPSAGDSVTSKYQDRYEGYYLTKFEPYLQRAEMTRLSEGAVRTRGAAAVALGCKPWEVQIATQPDGGYDLELPHTYMPSKHDEKLEEVTVSVAGRVGWRIEIDAPKLKARMIPGKPPLFPAAVKYPLDRLGSKGDDVNKSLMGVTLPTEGTGIGGEIYLDWAAGAHVQISGLPQSGKSVLINSIVAQQIASGAEVAIIDDKSKAVDFLWCKDFVRPGGWGCDSETQAVAVLAMIYDEGEKRSPVLAQHGVTNWLELPPQERFTPITIIIDELSALLVLDPVPKGLPKDNPLVVEINETNFMKQMIRRYIDKIIAEQRFVGIRMLLASQIMNNNTGISPSTKGKIAHKALQGPNPSKSQREQSFNDASAVPVVPPHVRESGPNARGVGTCALEGLPPTVYKSLFAPVADYRARLLELGVHKTPQPEPTPAQIAKYAPTLDDDSVGPARADTPSGKPLDPRFGPLETFDENGKPLRGAAAAAAASKKLSNAAKVAEPIKDGPPCPECAKPINNGCEC